IVNEKSTPLGYIEAKDVGIDLDRAEEADQLKRYRSSLRNLILITSVLRFRCPQHSRSSRTSGTNGARRTSVTRPYTPSVRNGRANWRATGSVCRVPKGMDYSLHGATILVRGSVVKALAPDLLPKLPSFIRRVCSSFAPAWGELRTRL